MYHILHEVNPHNTYKVALLIKQAALDKNEIEKHYISKMDIPKNDVISFSLVYPQSKKKPSVKEQKGYLTTLLPELRRLGSKLIYVCDGEYFKTLTGVRKVDPSYGYVLPCKIEGYTDMNVVLSANYKALFVNPALQDKIDLSLVALRTHLAGTYVELGKNIIKSALYPTGIQDIKESLSMLQGYPALTCDIETFGLKLDKVGLGTITFCWDEHNGIAFPVDYIVHPDKVFRDLGTLGYRKENIEVRNLLRNFFIQYTGKLIYHNANFDVKILILELFMESFIDQQGMLYGLSVMTRDIEDTKLITYLATNSTAGNNLSLKSQAHEFAGNYAQEDIKDITRIPLPELLEYNLVDGLSTWFVYKKHLPTVIQDKQEDIYRKVFLPSIKNILQMELTGMPIDRAEVLKASRELEHIELSYKTQLHKNPIIHKFNRLIQTEAHTLAHLKWVNKTAPISYFSHIQFKPNSPVQLQKLLYEELRFDVIDMTDTQLPATGTKTLKKLIHRTTDPDIIDLLNNLIGLSEVSKILSTFIKAFLGNSIKKEDGNWYLHGNFNLGGTVSGRLSSSAPNLQNLPSTSKYAKHIKRCFRGGDGWLFVGADFSSLEDYISALTTKDPNKLKVYEESFDGHCLRAAYYYRDKLPHIDLECPLSVNSIKDTHPDLRQDSKPCTFALTYQGTANTLVNNLGLTLENAKSIEDNYHNLYHVSDEWVQDRLSQAELDGYVTVAFGLRVRTPILAQTLRNTKATPYEAQAEGRTAGNALGQSYGLLNNRAANEMQERILASPFRLDIKPCAHIHDAQYFILKDDVHVVEWFNKNLIECMSWQELPEIMHDVVKIGAELDIFYEGWHQPITLPNGATAEEISKVCAEGMLKYNKEKSICEN